MFRPPSDPAAQPKRFQVKIITCPFAALSVYSPLLFLNSLSGAWFLELLLGRQPEKPAWKCDFTAKSVRRKHSPDEPNGFIGSQDPFGYHPKTG